MSAQLTGNLGFVRCGYKRGMGKSHGEIDTHGIFLMFFHESKHVIKKHIGSEFTLVGFTSLGRVDVWVLVSFHTSWVSTFITCPHCPVIKPMFLHRLRFDSKIVNLPLAGGKGGITEILHQTGKSSVFLMLPVKIPNSPAGNVPVIYISIAEWIFSGQQSGTGWGALRHGISVIKFHATSGQSIDVWRLNILRPVAADPLLTQIIEHNEILGFWLVACSENRKPA